MELHVMDKTVQDAVKIIVLHTDPSQIILFGSRATGLFDKDSDYDLCILRDNFQHKRKTAQFLYKHLYQTRASIDLYIETNDNYEKLKENIYTIHNEIYTKGIIIYDKAKDSGRLVESCSE